MTWRWEFKRKMDLTRIECFARAYLKLAPRFVYISKNASTDFYWDESDADKTSLEFLKKIKAGPEFLEAWTRDAQTKSQALTKFAENIYNDPPDPKDIPKLFKEYINLQEKVGYFAIFIRTIIHKALPDFKSTLKTLVKDNYLDTFTILTSTTKESFIGEEERKLYHLAKEIFKDKEILELFKKEPQFTDLSEPLKKKILAHAEKYSYIPCSYFDEPPHNLQYFVHRLRRIAKEIEKIDKVIDVLENTGKNIKEKQEKIMQELEFDTQTLNLIDCLQQCVYYKDFIREILNRSYYLITDFFIEAGKRLNHSPLEIKFLFESELDEYFAGKKDYSELIRKRMESFVLINRGGALTTVFGKEAQDIEKEIGADTLSEAEEIKGQTACAGYAKARARIISHPSDVQNETHDFILVTSMTTPEYVMAMQRALAIVTDEGGITCHAAIVAREMNKPCIIGTKIATKVLKDGDIIEVDADNGIIRKLS